MTKKQKKQLYRIIASITLLVAIVVLDKIVECKYLAVLYLIPYAIVGWTVLKGALFGIKSKQPFDENFLMSIATIGAFALGEYTEAVAVMLFYQIGELFEGYAVGKSRQSITDLMNICPDIATIVREDGTTEDVDPYDVEIGSIILVKPGEKLPLDGVIVEGSSTLDTSALTGESVPRSANVGDEVLSGCINTSGVLKIKTTKLFDESTASKILDLVENASSRKSKKEAFISKFARVYTPIVCACALIIGLIPPIVSYFAFGNASWGTWVYRALTFLVVSCPCALVISIPLTFFAGLGSASRSGVLIKGSNYMEALSQVKHIVFDKTGTLTKGNFEVDGIHHSAVENKEILYLAAAGERYSSHPISISLRGAYCDVAGLGSATNIEKSDVQDVQEITGRGISATVDGKQVLIGNDLLMSDNDIDYKPCTHVGTVVHVASNGEYLGHILIKDGTKPTSKQAIDKLKALGIKTLTMLSGDKKNVCESVSNELGLTSFYGELLPQDKVSHVEAILSNRSQDELVCFVGDGMNDAPVLSMSDVGVAMGALGSEAAIEAADVVLMDDNPLKLSTAIRIAKKCLTIVSENIYFAIGVKILCLILSAVGIANMWIAIFADVGVMVIAVLNAIRAMHIKED